MDISLLLRVVWQPALVFKEFKNIVRIEPFLLVGSIVLISSANATQLKLLKENPVLVIAGLIQTLVLSFLLPSIGTAIAFLLTALFKQKINYLRLYSAFVLCELPYYLEGLLIKGIGLPFLGLGSLVAAIRPQHPFIFGILALFTPFFLWMIFLWWSAINQLIELPQKQRIVIASSLILFNVLLSGLWSQLQQT